MRLKHNKKRNVAFVYEALVRELTKAIIKRNKKRKNEIFSIIKEHFSKDCLLTKELGLYQTIYETKDVDRNLAEKLLIESRLAHKNIDKKKLFVEQSSLIRKINKTISNNIFNNFVPNYRSIASAYSIFNSDTPIKQRVLLEEKMIEHMSSSFGENNEDRKKHIDNIVYRTFVNKFNEQYGNVLLEEQKELLSKFIASFSDNGIELKIFMNEELGRLKKEVTKSFYNKDIREDTDMQTKAKEVLSILEGFKNEKINENMIEKTLKIQSLIKEISE